jgi:hypothetical protein
MGQFKPMVKMETTEPSVMLKLKKGGHVSVKGSAKAESGHKPMHKFDGGPMGVRGLPMVGGSAAPLEAAAPRRPSMADRRKAMMMAQMARQRPMKSGGDVAQDKAMIKKAMAQHDAQEHKGGKGTKLKLKSGGVAMGAAGFASGGIIKSERGVGPYKTTLMHEANRDNSPAKTGSVKNANAGGYKNGGKVARKSHGGVMDYVEGNVVGTPPGKTNTTTGEVKKANAGGYKKGGALKKAFATGGLVNTGKPVAMPQGHKKPTPPVVINQLSGTFKNGGKVQRKNGGGLSDKQSERESKGFKAHYEREAEENKALSDALNPMTYIRPLVDKVKGALGSAPGAVTKTRESTTVVPQRKKGGNVN